MPSCHAYHLTGSLTDVLRGKTCLDWQQIGHVFEVDDAEQNDHHLRAHHHDFRSPCNKVSLLDPS